MFSQNGSGRRVPTLTLERAFAMRITYWASRAVTGRRMLYRNADVPVQLAVQLYVKTAGQPVCADDFL